MVPPMISSIETINEDIDSRELNDAADKLKSQISKVYNKGGHFKTQFELAIPKDSHLEIGGDDSTVIRIYKGDRHIGNSILDCKVAVEETILYGDVILQISNGNEGVVVIEL